MDRYAASRAIAVAALVVALLVVVQAAVGAVVTAGRQPMAVRERIPTSPTAAAWGDAPSRTVNLSAQQMALPHGGGSVDEMRVQAMTNSTHVAIRLTWADPTRDANISTPHAYSDAVAVMLKGGRQPPITMGATGTPVDIWYWRASWQFGNHTGTGSGTRDMYTYPHPDGVTKPGLAADNPLSKNEYRRYAQNYYAKGYGSLTHAPVQSVNAHGARTEDGWQVTFVRERTTEGRYDAAFGERERMYLTVAAWNGSSDEVNGQKSLSYQFLTLDTKSGALAPAEDSGDGTGSQPSSGTLPPRFWNGLGGLLATVVVTYLIAYRSLRGEDQ